MAHPNKAKGARWEHAVKDYINGGKEETQVRIGHRNGAHDDWGDLEEIENPTWIIECKDDESHSIQSFIDQMSAAMARSGRPFGVVIKKQRGKNVSQAFAIMPIRLWNYARCYIRLLERERKVSRDELAKWRNGYRTGNCPCGNPRR